jgi:hypothetical protein
MNRPSRFGDARNVSLVLCLAALASATHAREVAREVVTRSAARGVATQSATLTRAQRLTALRESGAADALVAEIEQLIADRSQTALARESLLDRGLHELARVPPTPAGRSLLERVARQEPQIFVRVDPDHGTHAVPLYDPAATARFVLKQWDRTTARQLALSALAANGTWPLERFARDATPPTQDAVKAGIEDAFRTVDAATLAGCRESIIAALGRGDRIDEIAALSAARLRDAELAQLVVGHADADVALNLVRRVPDVLDSAAALDVLIAASRRQEIASASLLAMGRVARRDTRAKEYLFDALNDGSSAPSSAAALASLQDPDVVALLGRNLQTAKHESMRRTLALALQLDGSPAARAQLDKFAKSRLGSAQLQKEIRAWLAQ